MPAQIFYQDGDYQKAIEYYQKALDLEKEQSKLGKTIWHVLVGRLNCIVYAQQTFQGQGTQELRAMDLSPSPILESLNLLTQVRDRTY